VPLAPAVEMVFSIVLKPGPAWRVDPGLEPGWIEEKIEEGKTRCDSVDSTRPSQKPGCNPLTFVFIFFTKTTSS